jgi:hypothetical protein
MKEKIPASRRCLMPFPVTKAKSISRPAVRSRVQRSETLRFDDAACNSTATALAQAFIDRNPDVRMAGWQQPDLTNQLSNIHSEFLTYPVDGVGEMQDLAERYDAGVVVGVIDSLSGEADVMVPSASSAFVGIDVPYRRVQLRHSTDHAADQIFLPERRIEIAARKFSTPNRGVVSGPYLFVAAIDLASGLALRFRAWPIWLDGYLQVVRSHYERVGVGALDALGCTCMTPMRIDQLDVLQEALGVNWLGSIQTYPYLMDLLMWPSFGHRVGIVEILGLGSYKRYANGQEAKIEKLVEGAKRGDYTAMLIDVPRGSAAAAASYITDRLESFVRGPIYSNRS